MRNRIGSTRAIVKESTKGQPVATSFGSVATCFLTLPGISLGVPVRSVHHEDDGGWLQAAKLCAELVEDDEIIIHDTASAQDIISQALSAWTSKHCAEIQVLDKFELVAALDQDSFGLECADGDESNTKCLYIGFQSQHATPFINVKTKVEALEAAYPRLGQTAVSIAEKASYRTFTAFTPNVAFHQAQNLYWCGADNDEDFKEEAGFDSEIDEGALLPSQFFAAIPSYLIGVGNELGRDEIQRIAQVKDEAGEAANIILTILDLIDQDARLPDLQSHYYGESAFFSFYMGTGDDMLARVIDDFYQNTGNDGDHYTDMYGVAKIPINKRAFLKWKAGMEKGYALYTQLDKLMRCIGEVQ